MSTESNELRQYELLVEALQWLPAGTVVDFCDRDDFIEEVRRAGWRPRRECKDHKFIDSEECVYCHWEPGDDELEAVEQACAVPDPAVVTPEPTGGGKADEYASESVWAELRGLYEIAKKAWAVRTSTDPEAPGELDEALDFYANVALPAHLARIVKPVPYPRAAEAGKAEGWHRIPELPLSKEEGAELDLPDSDVWVLASTEDGSDVAMVQLEFTDDSEGHGEPYWATEGGDLALCNYPYWMPILPLPAPPTSGGTRVALQPTASTSAPRR